MTALLEGVHVLDLSQYIPGPYTTRIMADHGAKIIKIEPPGGDPMRTLGCEDDGLSPVYQALNHDKTILNLDLKHEGDREVFKEWLKSADVLLEGFRPGTLARLGFADEILAQINPGLITCHLSGFGQQGQDAQRAGHDLGYGARAGLYSQIAMSNKPTPVFPPVADHAAGLEALALIAAALYRREKTGQGAQLDISIYGAVSGWQYLFQSDLPQQLGGAVACYNVYETSDNRYITLAALEAKFWCAFCEVVGREDWIPRHTERMPQQQLIAELTELFKTQSLSSWQMQLGGIDCCFEPIPAVKEFSATHTV